MTLDYRTCRTWTPGTSWSWRKEKACTDFTSSVNAGEVQCQLGVECPEGRHHQYWVLWILSPDWDLHGEFLKPKLNTSCHRYDMTVLSLCTSQPPGYSPELTSSTVKTSQLFFHLCMNLFGEALAYLSFFFFFKKKPFFFLTWHVFQVWPLKLILKSSMETETLLFFYRFRETRKKPDSNVKIRPFQSHPKMEARALPFH